MAKINKPTKKSAYNAQRTYESAAKKFEADAQKSKGSEKRAYSKAAARMRNQAQQISRARKNDTLQDVTAAISNAINFRKGNLKRGDTIGEALLSGNNAGHRFFSLTKDIWQNSDYENRYDALRDFFGEDLSILEMIEKLSEETGIDILQGNINFDTDSFGGLSKEEYLDAIGSLLENA